MYNDLKFVLHVINTFCFSPGSGDPGLSKAMCLCSVPADQVENDEFLPNRMGIRDKSCSVFVPLLLGAAFLIHLDYG